MLKSIIAAAFMTSAFTIVTVGTATITNDHAFAGKKEDKKKKKKKKFEKIKSDTGDTLYGFCAKHSDSKQTTNSRGDQFRCCSKKADYCVICPVKGDCKKRKYRKFTPTIFNKPGLGTGSSGTQLAPAKDKPKPRIPPVMGTFQKAPAANAPTADTPKSGPAIIKNRIQ